MRHIKTQKLYDACVYTVQVPEHTFLNGSIVIRFDKLTNLKVTVNYGAGESMAEKSIPAANATVARWKQYELKLSDAPYMSITALPTEGETDVQLEFEYWVDGV
jgi:hypothetical protein